MRTLLILGGSSEATALAHAVAQRGWPAIVSLAGRTRAPTPLPVAQRVGGFGGAAGLAAWLRDSAMGALVDATHPYAATMTRNAATAARLVGVPFLRIDRPPWRAGSGDRWLAVADMAAAASVLGPVPRRVLLTIGRRDLAPFIAAGQHHYLVRSVDPPEGLPRDAAVIVARGPFNEAEETRLLRDHRIDILVSKNAGGEATAAKLHAARRLGLPVVMLDRPILPPMPSVPDVAGALAWLDAR